MKEFVKESFKELLNKVSWPTWEELSSSAVIVLFTALILALLIFGIDSAFGQLLNLVFGVGTSADA